PIANRTPCGCSRPALPPPRGTIRLPRDCRSPDARRAWRRAGLFRSCARVQSRRALRGPARRVQRRRCSRFRPSGRCALVETAYHSSLVARDTLIDFFRDITVARGDFLVYDDGFRSRSYTYSDVGRAAEAFAAKLYHAGLKKGDKVLFWSENRPEWVVAF